MKKTILLTLSLLLLSACGTPSTTNPSIEESKNNNTKTTQSSSTYNFDSLVVENKGLAQEDLELINLDPKCQLYKDNAYKIDFELTNNFDKQINFTGKTLTDVWTTSTIMTTKMSELGLEALFEAENIEVSGIMGTQIDDKVCFSQQNNRLNIQPGETVNYPLYFSIPPNLRNTKDTVTLVLGPNMHDYSDPTNTIDFSSDHIEIIEFEI